MPVSNHVSLQTLRAASQAREMADKRAEVRKKSLLILVHQYLDCEGFSESAKQLATESKLVADNFAVCDDDLHSVICQYEQWYVDKFEKYPRFAKRVGSKNEAPPPKGTRANSDLLNSNGSNAKAVASLRRRSLPRSNPNNGMSRYNSESNLQENPNAQSKGGRVHPRSRGSPNLSPSVSGGNTSRSTKNNKLLDVDNRKKEYLDRKFGGQEKKDHTKSSSDSDSEKFVRSSSSGRRGFDNKNNPVTASRMNSTVLDLKSMISDYTRLEDNIGDIGKGYRNNKKDNTENGEGDEGSDILDDRLVKAPGTGLPPHFTGDMKDLAQSIQKEVLVENPSVKWGDVLGVEDAKRLLKEAVVYPLKYPQLFVGRFKPWRGVLLYGPPGTGKTLLAKAVATECNTTFFNISATTLVSKWRGDSEKLVRVLFEMARYYAPSTIFVDEVDALMGSRAADQEHEASRRMKTQLLVEMDGLTASNDRVFLLAASNIPWELDPAMLRRLEKRILVPLPSAEARMAMFEHNLPEVLPDLAEAGQFVKTILDYEKLSTMSEGYSGSDLAVVCREAAMMSLRKVFKILEDHSVEDEELPDLQLEDITMTDVEISLKRTKPAQQDTEQYRNWHEKFGSA